MSPELLYAHSYVNRPCRSYSSRCPRSVCSGVGTRLSRNGFALYETHERLIARAASKNGVYPTTLHTIYPDFGLIASDFSQC